MQLILVNLTTSKSARSANYRLPKLYTKLCRTQANKSAKKEVKALIVFFQIFAQERKASLMIVQVINYSTFILFHARSTLHQTFAIAKLGQSGIYGNTSTLFYLCSQP